MSFRTGKTIATLRCRAGWSCANVARLRFGSPHRLMREVSILTLGVSVDLGRARAGGAIRVINLTEV